MILSKIRNIDHKKIFITLSLRIEKYNQGIKDTGSFGLVI